MPRRLVEILARALAREPVDRYSNVSELREDVRRFLVGGLYLPTRTFDAGETIVQQGDRGDCAYVVVSGTCRVTRRVGDGAERELRTMGPGSVFGEMALLLESPRTASVTAIDTVTTLVVSRQELEVGLGSGSWLELLVKALAQRFRELEDHLEQPLVAGQ